MFAGYLQTCCLATVLSVFNEEWKHALPHHYFLSDLTDMHIIASLMRALPLSLHEQYIFCTSPVDPQNLEQASEFLRYCSVYAYQGHVSLHSGGLIRQLPSLMKPTSEVWFVKIDWQWISGGSSLSCRDWRIFMQHWISISGCHIVYQMASETVTWLKD